MTMPSSIGIFGGTFDPVHNGHITLALDLKNHLHLNEMRLIPCRLPPHRALPSASDKDRLHMLELAIAGTPLRIDDSELKRQGPSYSVDTLQALRNELGSDCAIVMCMGMDAFSTLPTWHRWETILTLAHIAVVTRADYKQALDSRMNELLNRHQTKIAADLNKQASGKIYLTQLSQIPVSSTVIRQQLASNDHQNIAELNTCVQTFIQQKGLYRP